MRVHGAIFVGVIAATLVSSASATESTIVRGVGMGKIRVGMTLTQVKHVFGPDSVVNARSHVGGMQYVELGWEFSSWGVGFLNMHGTYRAAQVETTLRSERTREGIGVGSSFKAVVRAFPQVICTQYYPTMSSTVTTLSIGPNGRYPQIALVVAKDRKQLAFLVKSTSRYYDPTAPYVVYEVIVRNSVPEAVDFPPNSLFPAGARCELGWRERGLPYKPR